MEQDRGTVRCHRAETRRKYCRRDLLLLGPLRSSDAGDAGMDPLEATVV